jgi:hypothetical protein
MIIFVQPIADSNETYLVDVGFGGANLAQPILLSDAETNVVWGAVPPEGHRLTRGAHPLSSLGEIIFPPAISAICSSQLTARIQRS